MATHRPDPKDLAVLSSGTSRRMFLGGAAAAVAAASLLDGKLAWAGNVTQDYAASPPAGFVPFTAPGRVVKVKKAGSLMPNGFWPKPDDAKEMLRRALQELTGEADMAQAASKFVHHDDKVVVKVNGIGSPKMSTNPEVVLPFIEAMIAAGVPPENITVLEQWGSYLQSTRISAQNVPRGVKISIHNNTDSVMESRAIPGTGASTRFVRALTESTAVIAFPLIKDHSISGYTGCMKNMTHGCNCNPSSFHSYHESPHIALLYAQDVIKTRVRLHVTDGFKVMAHGGPTWKLAQYVVPHEALYVSTDPVAMDTIGWGIVEEERAKFKLKSLSDEGRVPGYIRAGADLGLGVADKNAIQLREIAI
jgi:uncharacterized protein (DUF362 family)